MKKALASSLNVWSRMRGFAAIVRSPGPVRSAFIGHPILRCWWRLVLLIHGKPSAEVVWGLKERTAVADGFRFYGYLYRLLSVVIGLTAGLAGACELLDWHWALMMVMAAAGLWYITGLVLTGANFLAGSGITNLVVFLFLLTMFLTAVCVAISGYAKALALLPDWMNISLLGLLLLLGVGSYLIEVIALVSAPKPGGPA